MSLVNTKIEQTIINKEHEKMTVSCAISQIKLNLSFLSLSTPFSPPRAAILFAFLSRIAQIFAGVFLRI